MHAWEMPSCTYTHKLLIYRIMHIQMRILSHKNACMLERWLAQRPCTQVLIYSCILECVCMYLVCVCKYIYIYIYIYIYSYTYTFTQSRPQQNSWCLNQIFQHLMCARLYVCVDVYIETTHSPRASCRFARSSWTQRTARTSRLKRIKRTQRNSRFPGLPRTSRRCRTHGKPDRRRRCMNTRHF